MTTAVPPAQRDTALRREHQGSAHPAPGAPKPRAQGPRALALALAALALSLMPTALARAESYFVAPDGNDGNPGSQERPFATMGRAQTAAQPGDTVFFRGGTYVYASATAADAILLNKSGRAGQRIQYFAYADEKPVFDFSNMTARERITGIRVTASFLHLRGLELKGVPQRITTANESWGIYNLGSDNLYEALDLHHIAGPGLFIGGGSNNLVLNCDSHDNYDPLSKAGAGENADGFGCHGNGTNNVFRGCRAWWNTDDGFDFISAKGVCIVENSWAFYNGFLPGTFEGKKNGNGFKAGGYGTGTVPANPPRHVVRGCLAFRNRAAGFYANHHPIGGDWFNNTGYKNPRDFDMLLLQGGTPNHKLRNNLSYGSNAAIANFNGGDAANNSWQLPVMVSDADFESVDLKGVDGPREADGSLPDLRFMKLAAGSDLIDKGRDVGLPFVGNAPDLGCYERGARRAPPEEPERDASTPPAQDAGSPERDAASADAGAPQRDAGSSSEPRDAGSTRDPGSQASPGPRAPDARAPVESDDDSDSNANSDDDSVNDDDDDVDGDDDDQAPAAPIPHEQRADGCNAAGPRHAPLGNVLYALFALLASRARRRRSERETIDPL